MSEIIRVGLNCPICLDMFCYGFYECTVKQMSYSNLILSICHAYLEWTMIRLADFCNREDWSCRLSKSIICLKSLMHAFELGDQNANYLLAKIELILGEEVKSPYPQRRET